MEQEPVVSFRYEERLPFPAVRDGEGFVARLRLERQGPENDRGDRHPLGGSGVPAPEWQDGWASSRLFADVPAGKSSSRAVKVEYIRPVPSQ
jgi:hypothetical protein